MRSFDGTVGRDRFWAALAGLAIALLTPVCAFAENLGRIGTTYPILEQDAREWVSAEMAKRGPSRQTLNDTVKKSVQNFLNDLPALPGIGRVERNATRYVDGVHVFRTDVKDAKGKVLIKAGSRFDMLAKSKLDGMLMLLDGRDPKQVQMLQRLWAANNRVHAILVAGSVVQLTQKLRQPLFYDYGGAIGRRFGVTRVPVLIGQDGNRFRIEEMKP